MAELNATTFAGIGLSADGITRGWVNGIVQWFISPDGNMWAIDGEKYYRCLTSRTSWPKYHKKILELYYGIEIDG